MRPKFRLRGVFYEIRVYDPPYYGRYSNTEYIFLIIK